MASSQSFVDYVCEQLAGAGEIGYKRMFGEYGIYCNGIYFAMICDDQFFVKVTPAGEALLPQGETGLPYTGAKPAFLISDLEDRDFLARLAQETCAALPPPKPKKKKTKEA